MKLTTTQLIQLHAIEAYKLAVVKRTVIWDSVPDYRKERLLKNIRISAEAEL